MIEDSGLSVITVMKSALIAALKTNLEQHRSEFLKAQEGYRKVVIETLDKMLADARNGKEIRTRIDLTAPTDQSRDYTRVLKMLEMSIKDEIQITEQEFSQYVMDDWQWKKQFTATSAMYAR